MGALQRWLSSQYWCIAAGGALYIISAVDLVIIFFVIVCGFVFSKVSYAV